MRTGGDPGVPMPCVGRQKGVEEAAPRVRRKAVAPAGGERKSGTPAVKRHGLWAESAEVCPPRCPERWSWSGTAGGWRGWRGCAWRDVAGGLGCEEAAQDGPLNRRRRRSRWKTGREEAGRSVGGGPKEPEALGGGRRGESGQLPWEPAASPSPTFTERD